MIGERIELWHKEEYHYPAAHGLSRLWSAIFMRMS